MVKLSTATTHISNKWCLFRAVAVATTQTGPNPVSPFVHLSAISIRSAPKCPPEGPQSCLPFGQSLPTSSASHLLLAPYGSMASEEQTVGNATRKTTNLWEKALEASCSRAKNCSATPLTTVTDVLYSFRTWFPPTTLVPLLVRSPWSVWHIAIATRSGTGFSEEKSTWKIISPGDI